MVISLSAPWLQSARTVDAPPRSPPTRGPRTLYSSGDEVAPGSHEDAKRGDARLLPTSTNPHHYGQSRMDRPPPHVHGKEGVDGSSPSEGSKSPANRDFLVVCAELQVRRGSASRRETRRLQGFRYLSLLRFRASGRPRSHQGRTRSSHAASGTGLNLDALAAIGQQLHDESYLVFPEQRLDRVARFRPGRRSRCDRRPRAAAQ